MRHSLEEFGNSAQRHGFVINGVLLLAESHCDVSPLIGEHPGTESSAPMSYTTAAAALHASTAQRGRGGGRERGKEREREEEGDRRGEEEGRKSERAFPMPCIHCQFKALALATSLLSFFPSLLRAVVRCGGAVCLVLAGWVHLVLIFTFTLAQVLLTIATYSSTCAS